MKVFLSSTAQDLDAYRRVADDTIQRLQQQSIAMERFGPLPGMPVEECEGLARKSDVVLCIVAHRYGFVPEKGRGSITRREVEAAKNAGKDVLVWIVDDNHPWIEKKEQDLLADPSVVADPAKVAEVAAGVAGLLDFKTWLRTKFTPETFTTPDDLGKKIAVALANYVQGRSAPPISQDRISISRLPTTSSELFGRETELKLLDDAWANPNINIVSFVAWGGVGKTALVNHWLKRRMARDNYRGAERVYGWSFFSQGTSELAASADLFIDQALRWFGDSDPTVGTPWDKGERLARYIRQSQTLLILDGLEPLQYPPGLQEGRLKDAGMQALLVELAAQQPGLCVISTRERVADLVEFENSTVVGHNLDHLSPQAGAQILRSLNVKGDDEELEKAARELDGHAFSLTLLGSYLDEVLEGDIRRRSEIENLFDDSRYGHAAQSMIAAYVKTLGEGTELAILRLLGLFNRPADHESIAVLRKPPAIEGLTDPLQHLKGRDWNRAVSKLRRIKLLAEGSMDEPSTLDAHPLVREYFKQQLKQDYADAWCEANRRLYEYLTKKTKEFPNTFEEMSPLYAALVHASEAGKHEEVLKEVYLRRILRLQEAFSIKKLAAFGAELAVLSSFFEVPWEQTVDGLTRDTKAFLMSQVGFCLCAMGRLREAIQPMQAGFEMSVEDRHWRNACIGAVNLADLYLTIGDLTQAQHLAEQGAEFANQATYGYERIRAQATLGNIMHQAGRTAEAVVVFREAEEMLKSQQPECPLLYGAAGYWYCDLLLAREQVSDVTARAVFALKNSKCGGSLLDIALDNLALGRATLLESQRGGNVNVAQAEEHLRLAVVALHEAGVMDELPRGLLARSELCRFLDEFDKAEKDLAQVQRIAARGGMLLHLADYHLESARLKLAQGNKDKAREHLANAEQIINRIGYHRRDKEVSKIKEQLD